MIERRIIAPTSVNQEDATCLMVNRSSHPKNSLVPAWNWSLLGYCFSFNPCGSPCSQRTLRARLCDRLQGDHRNPTWMWRAKGTNSAMGPGRPPSPVPRGGGWSGCCCWSCLVFCKLRSDESAAWLWSISLFAMRIVIQPLNQWTEQKYGKYIDRGELVSPPLLLVMPDDHELNHHYSKILIMAHVEWPKHKKRLCH